VLRQLGLRLGVLDTSASRLALFEREIVSRPAEAACQAFYRQLEAREKPLELCLLWSLSGQRKVIFHT